MRVDNIKCCPSCGTQGILKRNNRTYFEGELTRNCYVYCPKCDFRGPRVLYMDFENKTDANNKAIEKWNRRV